MNRDKFILYLTQQIGFTREAIRDQSTCPNLRVRIGLEAKLELLTDLLKNVNTGGFSKAKLPEPQETYGLVEAVLAWWKEHKHDSFPTADGDEDNVYRETPDFVKLAQKLEKHED